MSGKSFEDDIDRVGAVYKECNDTKAELARRTAAWADLLTKNTALLNALQKILNLHTCNRHCVHSLDDCYYTEAEMIAAEALEANKL